MSTYYYRSGRPGVIGQGGESVCDVRYIPKVEPSRAPIVSPPTFGGFDTTMERYYVLPSHTMHTTKPLFGQFDAEMEYYYQPVAGKKLECKKCSNWKTAIIMNPHLIWEGDQRKYVDGSIIGRQPSLSVSSAY